MNTFFDESGTLNIDDLILAQPSFQMMMQDGVISDDELQEQSQRVMDLLHQLEATLSPQDVDKVRQLLAEISVLVAANNLHFN